MGRVGAWMGLAVAVAIAMMACVGNVPTQACTGDRPQACAAGAGKIVCIRASDDCATKCTIGANARPVVGADVASGTLYCPSTQKANCGNAWAQCCPPEHPVFCDNTPAAEGSSCWELNTDCATIAPCSGRLPDRSAATGACFNGTTPHCGTNWWAAARRMECSATARPKARSRAGPKAATARRSRSARTTPTAPARRARP